MIKDKKEIIKRLRNDDEYYGAYGRKFISNSDVSTLFKNPLALGSDIKISPALVIGRYFHTALLEPNKLKSFKVVDTKSRSSKLYKDTAGSELLLLQSDVDNIKKLVYKVKSNAMCTDLMNKANCDYEQPEVGELFGNLFKAKADIVNDKEKLIIDLKTTADISKFRSSAYRYNYDSQAFIYKSLFGYDFVFIVIDKITKQLGLFECSEQFLLSGEAKVERASDIYNLFFNDPDFDAGQYFINKQL